MVRRRKLGKKSPEQLQVIKEEAFERLDEIKTHEESEFETWRKDKRNEHDTRIPGKVVGGTKTMWTRKDIEERWPVVTFVPESTETVTFNGVKYQLLAGAENHVPEVIRDQYYRCKQRERNAGKGLPAAGYVNTIDLGAGALPRQD